MRTQEEYYEQVLRNRELAASEQVLRCTCPNGLCEWHGKCRECVALHRFHGDHIPACLQNIIADRIAALAGAAELTTAPKEGTPVAFRRYVRLRDGHTGR